MADDDDKAWKDEADAAGDGGEEDGDTDTGGSGPAQGADGHHVSTVRTLLVSRQQRGG